MKRMLINATQEEELRMAMVDGQRLYDLNIELPSGERKKANIYKGKITRIEPSLEAAFVNYGADRHGFLPLKEISSEYFVNDVSSGGKPNIREVLKEGQDIVVQIDKEERGNKGAALTTFVSLAGRFIVLKPNKARSGGVSRRIVGEERDMARQALDDVEIPSGMSVILRTAGIDRSTEELQWDMENLLAVWEAIKKVVVERPSPFLIYRESNAVIRALRDYLSDEIGEILIDDDKTYAEAREFVEQVMPQNLRKLKLYTDAVPLFTRFQIESQIESAFAHSVNLPSGGSLVIDHTEALVSIDINSARATKGGDIEATALNTNLEAADEVGRQLRLRDLGGLVVIDFIDMGPQKNQREVENRLREAVRQDRARVQIGKISRFGLLEMSRQRLRPSLGESSYLTCPRCSGIGNIRSVESLALAILRLIGEEARKERTAKVIAQLPVEVATYLLNEKRNWVQSLESRNDTQVILVANPALETPHYQIRRVRDDQVELPENTGNSYKLADLSEEPDLTSVIQEKKVAELAAVATMAPATPVPAPEKPRTKTPGLMARIFGLFASRDDGDDDRSSSRQRSSRKSDSRSGQRGRRSSGSQRGPDKRHTRTQKAPRKRGGRDSTDDATRPAGGGKPSDSKRSEDGGRPSSSDGQADTRKSAGREDSRKSSGKRRSRGGRRRKRGGQSDDAKGASHAASRSAGEEKTRDASQTSSESGQSRSRRRNPPGTAPGEQSAHQAGQPVPDPAARPANSNGASDDRPAESSQRPAAPEDSRSVRPAPRDAAPSPSPSAEVAPRSTNPPAEPRVAAPRPASAESDHRADDRSENRAQSRPETRPAETRPAPATEPDRARAGNGEATAGASPEVRETARPQTDKTPGRLLPWESPAATPDKNGGNDQSEGNRPD